MARFFLLQVTIPTASFFLTPTSPFDPKSSSPAGIPSGNQGFLIQSLHSSTAYLHLWFCGSILSVPSFPCRWAGSHPPLFGPCLHFHDIPLHSTCPSAAAPHVVACHSKKSYVAVSSPVSSQSLQTLDTKRYCKIWSLAFASGHFLFTLRVSSCL